MESNSLPQSQSRTPPRNNTTDLEFITFTNPESAKSSSNRQRVRSQAMRAYHRSSDTPRRSKNVVELDISPLLLRDQIEQPQHTAGPVTALDATRMDPFFQYPIEMGHRERELYTHCKFEVFGLGS
jgi:hypothetical protein